MTLKDELIASRNGGGAGIMLVTTLEGGYQFIGLDADDNIITLDPTAVTYGGEFGLRLTEEDDSAQV